MICIVECVCGFIIISKIIFFLRREVVIVSLCAIKSIEREDYEEAKKLGKRLISVSEGPSAAHAAAAAQRLGMDASLTDLPLRHQLIDLALLHCDAQHIETLLQIRFFDYFIKFYLSISIYFE